MERREFFLSGAALLLAGCNVATSPQLAAEGRPANRLYRIRPGDRDRVIARMLDAVNAQRRAAGRDPVAIDTRLNAAAASHSRDMARQGRPWNFGSDGSSPIERARRAGYPGRLVGEAISETYEDELQTLAAWMREAGTRAVILDRQARALGFGWYQEIGGKIWWTLVMGG